jgi:hypothetical protein
MVQAWLTKLTTEEAWVRGGSFLVPGREVYIDIDGVGRVPAVIKRAEVTGLELDLQPNPMQRANIFRKLHTRVGAAGTQSTNPMMLVVGALRKGLGYD